LASGVIGWYQYHLIYAFLWEGAQKGKAFKMKFSAMEYKRIDYDAYSAKFSSMLQAFKSAASAEEQLEAVKAYFALYLDFSTMYNLSYIRHTVNTEDKFYSDENDYYDEKLPRFEALEHAFGIELTGSHFRPELEKALGELMFKNTEIAIRAFDEKIMDDMAEENRLKSQYQKLIASAQIPFDGKSLNISQLGFYMSSPDREVRKSAYAARTGFFMQHTQELDTIYDELVKNRTRQAHKLGFNNFIELGYLRRTRNCYDSAAVKAFRDLVKAKIVPVTQKITEKQRVRLGVDTLMFYDEDSLFADGSPRPEGTPEQIFENGKKMYHELSPETDEFFSFMLENELFDVLGRRGKAAGGYCTGLLSYKSPFIFANFNGTYDDIGTLTHEAGHALQYYLSRDIYPPVYIESTLETAEIHSMSMEFFTWPWMHLFFGAKADKYRYMHLGKSLTFIPYGCAVDEFQHIVYENPDMSPNDRKEAWMELEKVYMPHVNYDGDPFFGAGCRWQRQLHIYEEPFYYIDYCLAQTCALEFWALAQKDRASAFERYLGLCRLGGTGTFISLLKKVGLANPFDENCLNTVSDTAQDWLFNFDESKL
jgi:M3 family oligoendopeptidase